MDFQAAVTDEIALLNAGKPLEAFDRYFDDDGVMLVNDETFGTGKAECRAKQETFIFEASSIIGNITHCAVDVEDEICVFRNRTTFVDETGQPKEMDGLHWQRWSNGKIVEERYYRGEAMEQKLAEGILDESDAVNASPLDDLSPHAKTEATALRAAVVAALAELVDGEHIEIAPDATDLVADELVVAGLEAHNPRHALKTLRLALIHSDNVEEVYAADHTLETAFRKALGG